MQKKLFRWAAWSGLVVVAAVGVTSFAVYKMKKTPAILPIVSADEIVSDEPTIPEVKVIHPKKGVVAKLTTQPGSVQAFESVHLFTKVPGFLEYQKVDIGDHVTRGQLLARVDVPELRAQRDRCSSLVEQAISKVKQMKARVKVAEADWDAAKAGVVQAEANYKRCGAMEIFRLKVLERMEDLWKTKSLEFRLVDEATKDHDAAIEAQFAARAAIDTTKAIVIAGGAKVDQANADVEAAQSEVKVARAELDKAKAMVDFATITAPFDGVITQRGYFENDYIRSGNEGTSNAPLLTVHRTDKMRVVVMVPDRDVPFCDVGDSAEMEIDSLPGKKYKANVSRIGKTLDPQTRLMRVEVDLPNPSGQICHGMYGQVTIVLDKQKDMLSIPAACVVGKSEDDIATVYVITDGHAHQTAVHIGASNGLRVMILDGLTTKDELIYQPGATLTDGADVRPIVWDESSPKSKIKTKTN